MTAPRQPPGVPSGGRDQLKEVVTFVGSDPSEHPVVFGSTKVTL